MRPLLILHSYLPQEFLSYRKINKTACQYIDQIKRIILLNHKGPSDILHIIIQKMNTCEFRMRVENEPMPPTEFAPYVKLDLTIEHKLTHQELVELCQTWSIVCFYNFGEDMDITPITPQNHLQALSSTTIPNLHTLTNLQFLCFTPQSDQEFEVITHFNQLWKISINMNNVTRFPDMSNLKNLRSTYFSNVKSYFIWSNLKTVPWIRSLRLVASSFDPSILNHLPELINLKILYDRGHRFLDYTPLTNLLRLETLTIVVDRIIE